MGTYEKPELLQANQTGGFVKGISEGLAAIGKGFEVRAKNQRAAKDKEKLKAFGSIIADTVKKLKDLPIL